MADDNAAFERRVASFAADYTRIVDEVAKVIVGHTQVVHEVMTCMLCGGHVLLEGVPGLGKTLLVRTLAGALDLSFGRLQFTPDLMPADITGTNILDVESAGASRAFRFQAGPIFANLVLADEINRATPKTQSAVLEAMQERTVTVAGVSRPLPSPFLVLATQNPLEMEGTYPLPEAQLDRFMFKVNLGFPTAGEISSILDRTTGVQAPTAAKVADAKAVLAMQDAVRQVAVASHVKDYVSRLVLATHPGADGSPELVRGAVKYGASPRAAQAILLGAKVLALRDGRANVAFDDIEPVVSPALRHRIIMSFEGQADGVSVQDVIAAAVSATQK